MKPSSYLDDRQFRALLRVARERRRQTAPRDHFLILFLGRTGLRITEALSLRVRDLYLSESPAFLRVRTLKGRKKRTDEVLLEASVVRQARRYLRRGAAPPLADSPLFPSSRPDSLRSLTRIGAHRVFKLYVQMAGLDRRITLHHLRHYRATTLLHATKDLEFVRAQLRHQRITSTQTYLHTSPELAKRYLEQLDQEDGE